MQTGYINNTYYTAHDREVRYADKGYYGAKTKGYDAAMKKATRGHPL
jgi:IS5 family transposase